MKYIYGKEAFADEKLFEVDEVMARLTVIEAILKDALATSKSGSNHASFLIEMALNRIDEIRG